MDNELHGAILTAFMDSDFKPVWSDSPRLFRRLSMGSKKLLKRLDGIGANGCLKHLFRSEGIMYNVYVKKILSNNYVCRATRIIPDSENINGIDDLLKPIDNIKGSTLNVITMCDMIQRYAEDSGYLDDALHSYIQRQRLEADNISADCHNLLHAFDDNYNNEFIPLSRYILRTWDIMQFAVKKAQRTVVVDADIVYPCVKLDYSKFELAMYNLAKVVLIYSVGHESPIRIRTVSTGNIEVSADFKARSDYELSNCDLELRVIKHIFRCMGGHFEISEERGTIHALGIIEAEFSCDEYDIPDGKDIRYIGTPEIMMRKKTSDKYIPIFKTVRGGELRFASDAVELSDVEDKEVKFAEMFFSKVFLV